MDFRGSSLLSTDKLGIQAIETLFAKTAEIKSCWSSGDFSQGAFLSGPPVVATLFFEPSTRTKTSFTVAAQRLGCRMVDVGMGAGSSLSKGESEVDTFLNISAMAPDLMIVRHSGDEDLNMALEDSEIPVISAGTGVLSHPTQALLDAFTIQEQLGTLQGKRVLICGDVAHSRVARSNAELLVKMGAEIGICGPEHFLPKEAGSWKIFKKLDDGLQWGHVIILLRVQHERHRPDGQIHFDLVDYVNAYSLTAQRLERLSPSGIVLHPGPVNWGVELEHSVQKDPRVKIFAQVKNGVFVRAALLTLILGMARS